MESGRRRRRTSGPAVLREAVERALLEELEGDVEHEGDGQAGYDHADTRSTRSARRDRCARRFCAAVYRATAKVMISRMVRTVFLSSFKRAVPSLSRGTCFYDTHNTPTFTLRQAPDCAGCALRPGCAWRQSAHGRERWDAGRRPAPKAGRPRRPDCALRPGCAWRQSAHGRERWTQGGGPRRKPAAPGDRTAP